LSATKRGGSANLFGGSYGRKMKAMGAKKLLMLT